MRKLDESQVKWILAEKRKCTCNRVIAETMNVSVRWVQALWARYRDDQNVVYPYPMGRPENGLPGRREHAAVLSARTNMHLGAARIESDIEAGVGIHIPHNTIHKILIDSGEAKEERKKKQQRKWVRYEREHSNSMWHTDYKQLDDGRWFIAYQDDASRFITGYGVFGHATTENAIAVLKEAVRNHGKPASVLTDHGSQFYANASEVKRKGDSEYEKKLVELEINQILARVNHPQTNGKLERLHGELQRKLHEFEDVAGPPGTACPVGGQKIEADPVARFVRWYNYRRHHDSLDTDIRETPAQAFIRKMPVEDYQDEEALELA